jgi:hypothetical protein
MAFRRSRAAFQIPAGVIPAQGRNRASWGGWKASPAGGGKDTVERDNVFGTIHPHERLLGPIFAYGKTTFYQEF